jgi:hypothetical protein
MVSVLNEHFPRLYNGTRELSVDESMILITRNKPHQTDFLYHRLYATCV